MNKTIKNLLNDFSKISEIEAILLAGSHSTGTVDKNSDYDIYIYSNSQIPIHKRKSITDKYFKYIELSNTYWEEEDDGILFDDTEVEFIYRNIDSIDNSLNRTLIKCEADIGYTTCIWYNLKNSIIIYDKNDKLSSLQSKYDIEYPNELRNNIIEKNFNLLKSKFPCYYKQIEKAIKRNDYVSLNHRLAAFLASYFDIIFAYNKCPHPGEKKILEFIKNNNLLTPLNMEKNILNAFNYAGTNDPKLLSELDNLTNNLIDLLR